MKIYLVRHGQTDWNYQKKIQGQQDVDINEQGIRQAEKLAEILKNVPFEYAVCSPLTRAHHTAEILLKYHSVPLSYDDGSIFTVRKIIIRMEIWNLWRNCTEEGKRL